MARKLALVYEDMYMFVDESVEQITEETKCVVFNKSTQVWAPELLAGSWACRMGPWEEPTEAQLLESKGWIT